MLWACSKFGGSGSSRTYFGDNYIFARIGEKDPKFFPIARETDENM
jgi:hypothetical protein